MSVLEIWFWVCAAGVAYTYVVYPVVLWCVARLWGRSVIRGEYLGTVSIVLAAHNEASRIAARRDELTNLLNDSGLSGELVIVSDGSRDGTAAAAREGAAGCVRVIELTQNVGKAAALTRAVASAQGDVIVFADARQRWAPGALRTLVSNFADPSVGGAS